MRLLAVSLLFASAASAQAPSLQETRVADGRLHCHYSDGSIYLRELGTACPSTIPAERRQPYNIAGNLQYAKPVDKFIEGQTARNTIRLQELEIQRLEQEQAERARCSALAVEAERIGKEMLSQNTFDPERSKLLVARADLILKELEACSR